jgi:hypothetical protein
MSEDKPRAIRDGLIPLGPSDTYDGVPVSSLCTPGTLRTRHAAERQAVHSGLGEGR